MKGTTVLIAIIAGLCASIFAGCTGAERSEQGKTGVVRNGGPFDNKAVREILEKDAGLSWIGAFSSVHEYPHSGVQRFYTITADPNGVGDKGGSDYVQVPTSDGIQVALEGTFIFYTAFDGTDKGKKLLIAFDETFGVRTYAVSGSGERLHPYDGDAGFQAWLNAVLRPIIDNELRVAIAKFRCEELVSSCALIVNKGATTVADAGEENIFNLEKVQEEVESGVKAEVKRKLGDDYLTGITFQLVKVKLPDKIQAAIDDAQASFAGISKSQALKEQAEQQKQAAEKLAAVYERSPALAQIQMIREAKELPAGTNVNIIIGGDAVATFPVGQGK